MQHQVPEEEPNRKYGTQQPNYDEFKYSIDPQGRDNG